MRAQDPASSRSSASSPRSCVKSPIARPAASSGSSTTAPPIAASSPIDRFKAKWPNIVLVHTPVHARWLNQIETYFSIVQRKVVTPNDLYVTAIANQWTKSTASVGGSSSANGLNAVKN
jgi:hypothetical protein